MLVAAGAACTAPGTRDAPAPTAQVPKPTVAAPTTGGAWSFVVLPYDGADPAPVVHGTTHRFVNPHPGSDAADTAVTADYRWIEYTVPRGWEVGDVYVGKHLGEPDEVALSIWTTAGLYPDPCRRGAELSPFDLYDHGHPDGLTISLASDYAGKGLAAQHGREASEPRSVVIPDPTDDEGTLALRLELTVPAELDLTSCDGGVYRAWQGYGDGDQPHDNHVAGQTDIVLQIDVDRAPLVVDASFRPASSQTDVDELYSVIGSIVMNRW
ncbi:hypothetical protein CXY01_27460 [Cellulomonas xylanilytica]|uniref:Uncharacterized protein n=1 Tax=Cellulomonas xylanilytica TaxID=233583 RepID=A0A510V628_9CELL|nr:hypothetical protein CXY01_27460 [Cellulomonas xylanilytica]